MSRSAVVNHKNLVYDAATLIRTSKLQCLQPGEPVCQTEKETVTH
jgi:hypothetical protein